MFRVLLKWQTIFPPIVINLMVKKYSLKKKKQTDLKYVMIIK